MTIVAKRYYIQRLLGIIILLAIGGLFYYVFSPEESSFFPQCPFHSLTGFDCPGCGSQRAIHHLLHLQFRSAFLSNPLLVAIIPYVLLAVYIKYFGGKEKYPRIRQILFSKNAVYIILSAIIVFWIGRNLI